MKIHPHKIERDYNLIAEFVDGFASGWKMAVPEAFKEALDIKLAERVIKEKTNGVTKKRTTLVWTQGLLYDFHVGDTIYDTKLGYERWSEALKHIKFYVQVQSARPSIFVQAEKEDGKIVKKQYVDHGLVQFRVYRPNEDKSSVRECEMLECTQEAFVSLLQTGIVRIKGNTEVDLFA